MSQALMRGLNFMIYIPGFLPKAGEKCVIDNQEQSVWGPVVKLYTVVYYRYNLSFNFMQCGLCSISITSTYVLKADEF